MAQPFARSFRSLFALLAAFLSLTHAGTAQAVEEPITDDRLITRIAFGSCAKEDRPQPLWDAVVASKPDLFLFLGDNIYGDTDDMAVLAAKYEKLGAVPGFQKLRETCTVLATWDDHDLGRNDAGADYPFREQSQQVFLTFWGDPADSPRRKRPGVYASYLYGPPDKRVQVILLDTRYFRSPLHRWTNTPPRGQGPYRPHPDRSTTVLGEAQWKWLEEQLKVPADLRVIGSSIQVVAAEHGWEKWQNFPHERDRLFRLIGDAKANGVVFVSGDRHFAELCRGPAPAGYPLYDVTASSINQPGAGDRVEPNPHRVGALYEGVNFGVIEIDWSGDEPAVELTIRDREGKPVIRKRLAADELQVAAR